MNSLRKIADLDPALVNSLLEQAFAFKSGYNPVQARHVAGKMVALIFEKPSLRTKVAFEVAAAALGATPVFLSSSQILASGSNESGRESVPDIARNLERFTDLIVARVYSHQVIVEIADSIEKPVINALCDRHHPTQALADLMAIRWHKGDKLKQLKVAYCGDGNNVATSLLQVCALMGINFALASPVGYGVPPEERDVAQSMAKTSGSTIEFTDDPRKALANADVVYTDTFVSMGQERERNERLQIFGAYQINARLMAAAKPDAIFMHCLPAHRGEEVTSEVFDGPQSIVFDQAECRLHIAKSLLLYFLS